MTSYTQEHLRAWNGALLPLQQEQLCQQASLDALTPISAKQAWEKRDLAPFLLACLQQLDATHPPGLHDIEQFITWFLDFPADTSAEQPLTWLFLSKCTLVVYGQRMSFLLDGSLPLSQALAYWNGVYGNLWQEIYYGLQTLPRRLISLTHKTRVAVQQHQPLTIDHWVGGMFPMMTHHPDGAERRLSVTTLKTPSKALAQVFRHMYHMPLPLALLRDEIQQKRLHVQSLRKHQAKLLGLLIKVAPANNCATLQSMDHAVLNAHQCLQALTISCEQDTHLSSTSIHEHGIDAIGQSILQTSSMATISTTPGSFAKDLRSVVRLQLSMPLDAWQKQYGHPGRLERYWIPGMCAFVAGNLSVRYALDRKEDIIQWTSDVGDTIRQFLIHWVWEPTVKVLDTIRFQDRRIGLSSKEGLKTDMESLERMVLEFARGHGNLTESEMAHLAAKVRDGDVTVVLRAYENEIKNPLRNAIKGKRRGRKQESRILIFVFVCLGDLIQALLIQVQKTKVDVELAMQALDKLLKSNELNFAFLAVAPSMLLTWGAFSWLRQWCATRSGKRFAPGVATLKDSLR
ncbi:NCA2-domain-containing protein [Hesseltinella vesiculosa]|uniref:NCA2-domain-containing protein n=1 Tax=Hesseltinella vesiculosa TaxID=101127 RepID=A0A1X2GH29_9FUNG|nr:NCA2-domain-containing protein [Hesseltinella vesiculosa]